MYGELANFTSSYHQDQAKLESKTCFVTAVHKFNPAMSFYSSYISVIYDRMMRFAEFKEK